MKVHGIIISPNVRKVLVALNVKGIEYENISVMPGTKTPEFLKISPMGLIPAVEDGSFAFSDSGIILEYLDETYPENSLMPSDPKYRAKSRWYSEYGGTAVFPQCATIFRQRMVNPYFFKISTDESVVEDVTSNTLPPILDYLETEVPDEGFFFGELGSADISIISPFINAEYGGYQIDGSRWPKMAAFMARGKAHPAFANCLAAEDILRNAIMNGAMSGAA